MKCLYCTKQAPFRRKICLSCLGIKDSKSRYSNKERVKIECFSCHDSAVVIRKREHNFCTGCWHRYFKRAGGSELEGMDYTRELVRIRDKHKCQDCGKVWEHGKRRFDIHHLEGCGEKSKKYDKVSEMDNMITMCHKCHLNQPEVRAKMKHKSSPRPLKDKENQRKWTSDNREHIRIYQRVKRIEQSTD